MDRRRIPRRLAVAAALPGLLLAHGCETPAGAGSAGLALGGCGGAGSRRGRGAAREPAFPAGPGLSGPGGGLPRRRRQHGRHRGRGPRAGAPAGRAAVDRVLAGRAAAGVDGQALGGAPRYRPGTRAWPRVPAADGRRHRPRAGQPAPAGGRRARRGLRRRLADGPAAGGKPVGAARGAGVRLLLRAVVSVPPDRQEGGSDGGRGGRLRPAARRNRRAGADPGRHPAGRHRRRGPRAGRQGRGWPHLAGPRRAGGQRAPLSPVARPVADGVAQRLRPAPPQPPGAARNGGRARAGLSGAARRRPHGTGCGEYGDHGARCSRVAGHDGDVCPDAPLLPAAAVARTPAAVHRVPLSPDDRRLGGAALQGRGAAWKGRTYARPDAVAGEEG